MVGREALEKIRLTHEEFEERSLQTDELQEILDRITEKEQAVLDEADLRRAEDWNALADEIVGSR